MTHCFDVDIAKRYGILEAILLNYFDFWIAKNEANGTNHYDGYYWTYNSISALVKLFPYTTKNKICNALNHLENEGLIATSNYNKSSYDRTKWYRLTDKGYAVLSAETVEILDFSKLDNRESKNQKSIGQKSEIDCREIRNGLSENQKPIPFNNHLEDTVSNTFNNTVINDEFEELWKLYPRKQGKKKALDYYTKARKKGTTYEEVRQGIEAYADYVRAEKTEDRFIKHGSTFFSEQAWQDDWSINNDTRRSNKECKGVRGTVREGEGSVRNDTPEWYRPFKTFPLDERSEGDA